VSSAHRAAAACWWRPFRTTCRAAVIHVDLTPQAAGADDALAWLDHAERARWQRYRYERPRREFARCRAALRATLCARLGCRNEELAFETSHHGKPFAVVGGTRVPVSFNVSHSGDHGLIALADAGRIGVDVEQRPTRHDPDGPIGTVFAPAERSELAAARGTRKIDLFLTLWTMKEALIKALGTGFSMDISAFEIPPSMRRGAPEATFRFPHDPAVRWQLEDLGNASFAAAVAHELPPVANSAH
jgi:4'-phosphopantetheinyl transferase